MKFDLNCIPPTTNHQSKRIVRVGKFSKLADSEKLVAAKDMIDALLLPHQPERPVPGPIEIALVFRWPWPSGTSKKKRRGGWEWKTSAPDADNVAKTLIDRLAALRFIDNDAEVVMLHISKIYSDTPGITIAIGRAAPPDIFDTEMKK